MEKRRKFGRDDLAKWRIVAIMTPIPIRIGDGAPGREDGTDVMGEDRRDRRSTRAGCRILLIAMAIQGLTPDYGNLASSWLLRLVTSGPADGRAADGDSAPIPRGDQDNVPGTIGSTAAARSALRGRLDAGGRIGIHILPVNSLERPGRTTPRSLHPPGTHPTGPDGRLSSLCRFLC
jgi:hypothetical protein